MESSSDENNFDDIAGPAEPTDKTQPVHRPLTHKPIARHYQPSKKIKFNRKTGVFQQERVLKNLSLG